MYTLLLIIFIAVFSSGWTSAERDVPGLATLMGVSLVAILLFRIFNKFGKEKFDRIHILLPIKMIQLALVRLFFIITNWLILLILFCIAFIIFRLNSYESWIIWFLISSTGIILAINAWPVIHRDLLYCLEDKYTKAILTGIYVIVTLIAATLFASRGMSRYLPSVSVDSINLIKENLSTLVFSAGGAIYSISFGVSLSILSLLIFHKRKSYLE